MELTIAFIVILVVSAIMSITGRGGGNFYVPVLVACGLSVLEAATTAQCILFTTALASLLVFQRSRTIDWKLALIIDPPTDIMALIGGYYAHRIPEHSLKLIFAVLLVLSGILMLQEIKDKKLLTEHKLGFWRRVFGEYEYVVNLWLVIPITAAAGFFAGMIGISCGSFKVPLMVLACGVPMRIAVGTSSAMIATTVMMGFIGHFAAGDFNPSLAIPLSSAAVAGGITGGICSLSIDTKYLKNIFACISFFAAVLMIVSIFSPMGN